MALEPMYLKGSEIQVGDIFCIKVGDRMSEVMNVATVSTEDRPSGAWVTVAGADGTSYQLPADERAWVLATR